MRGSLPSLSRNPPFIETPMSVPSVSKRSTKKNANITTKKSNVLTSVQPDFTTAPSFVNVQVSGLKSAPTVPPNSVKFCARPLTEKSG